MKALFNFLKTPLILTFLSVCVGTFFYYKLDEPFEEAAKLGIYWVSGLAVVLGFSLASMGPTKDKRFKTGHKNNETEEDYASVTSTGIKLLASGVSILLLTYNWLVPNYLSGSIRALAPGDLMTADETRKWVSSGAEWHQDAWRASGCPEQLDRGWVADPNKRADFYRVIRTDVQLLCGDD